MNRYVEERRRTDRGFNLLVLALGAETFGILSRRFSERGETNLIWQCARMAVNSLCVECQSIGVDYRDNKLYYTHPAGWIDGNLDKSVCHGCLQDPRNNLSLAMKGYNPGTFQKDVKENQPYVFFWHSQTL